MKFKAIFALFNSVLIVSFLLIFLMPLFLLGMDYFSLFWGRNWPIAVVFVLTLGGLNAYFIMNWGLFRHLEREDWPALVSFLEERILSRGMARPLYVRMILNAYLITSNMEGIRALEVYMQRKKPGLIGRFSLPFGIPYLLMKDPAVSEVFFSSLLASKKTSSRDWISWNRAFSLLQLNRPEEAKAALMGLLDSVRDPVLRMLCLYLLDVFARQDPFVGARVSDGRSTLKGEWSQQRMRVKIEKSSENMEIVILSKIVQDAREWLYTEETPLASPPVPEITPPETSPSASAGDEPVH
jgi:hypothetical protein